MKPQESNGRMAWLLAGVLAGLGVAFVWPHEQGLATTSDRDDKFAILTVPVQLGQSEGVFVLDQLTGQIRGAVLNTNSGTFTNFYVRNAAEDFIGNRPNAQQPQFAWASGSAALPSRGGLSMSSGVIYVGEFNTGRVVAYGFPYTQVNALGQLPPPLPLMPLDNFPFREAVN